MTKKYVIEPVETARPRSWGDIDPSTKELTGKYNGKTKGACKPSESIVTEGDTYSEVELLPPGVSPSKAIRDREKA